MRRRRWRPRAGATTCAGTRRPTWRSVASETTKIVETEQRLVETNRGVVEVPYEKEYTGIRFRIGEREFVVSNENDRATMEFLKAHFDIPDPQSAAELDPEGYRDWRDRMWRVIDRYDRPGLFNRDFLASFQAPDLALLAMKRGGILSWELGLGTMQGSIAERRLSTAAPPRVSSCPIEVEIQACFNKKICPIALRVLLVCTRL